MESQSPSTKRIITVFGGSGKQGSSVIYRLLETSRHEFTIRGVVRKADATSPRVLDIAQRGVECIFVDYTDMQSLRDAVRGSYGVFAMTDWWTNPVEEYQTQVGKNICDACLTTGVKHLVWSSAPHSTKISDSQMTSIGAFDSKADVEDYIEQRKAITGMAASYFRAGWFMNHIIRNIHADEHGAPIYLSTWNADEVHVPLFDTEADTGKFIQGMFRAGRAIDGMRVQGVSEWVTPRHIADKMLMTRRDSGEIVKAGYVQIAAAAFKAFIPPRAFDMVMGIIQLTANHGWYGFGSEERQHESDALLAGVPKSSWEEYVQRNGPWYWPDLASSSTVAQHYAHIEGKPMGSSWYSQRQ